ncbi:MAG: cupredoxin domain-containing protein [Hyphomicrobiales bacterium]|jgi:plastocyanin|nr:cupredoxin domain-containing protein [Hyphomicrobiales bacterium]MBV9977745.1 cupredoxin domain-containing protein [Hyphomicrobiales bacterium]
MRHALLLAAAACIAGNEACAGEVIKIKIDQLAYAPASVTAHVGDTVEWKNADFIAHTATSIEGRFDVMIPAGGTGRLELKKVGSFPYTCRFHPNMKGELQVM